MVGESMKVKKFDVIVEKSRDGWFITDVPALPGCHTQGKTKREALKNTREAISLYLEVLNENRNNTHMNN